MNEQEAKRLCALRELVRETFAQTLMIRTDTVSDTADFFDELGGDSLDSLDVAVHLEEICGQRVPEEEYALCRCVEDAALLLLRLEQGGAPEAAPEEKKTVTPITRFEDTPEYAAFQRRLRTADETGNPYFLCNDSPLRDTSPAVCSAARSPSTKSWKMPSPRGSIPRTPLFSSAGIPRM